jgi:splicing factor U2AF subunit
LPPPGPNGKPNFQSEDFEGFVEDIFDEFRKFGNVENLAICENLSDHMIGNVYIRYTQYEEAEAALKGLQGRFYNGTCPFL